MKLVPPGHYVGRPGFTSLQNQARFYYVIRKFGISKAELGVVSHGLRHQYANDHFEADAGGPSPVRGGTACPHGNKPARKRVSRVLGHNRERASTAYLGSSVAMRSKPSESSDPPAEQDGSHCAECICAAAHIAYLGSDAGLPEAANNPVA
jgi:hypothetical protein